MVLRDIEIKNFRCFGEEPTVIRLDDLTSFIGANGTGKTAVLAALNRMFGVSSVQRELTTDDFHVPPGEILTDKAVRELYCEVRIAFPELAKDEDGEKGAVPPSFNSMVVPGEGQAPYCRIRLSGKWENTEVEGGDVTPRLDWITSADAVPQKSAITPVNNADRRRIQVFYIPGSRDTSKQLANASGTLLNQLLKAVKWGSIKDEVKKKAEEARQEFLKLTPVQIINSTSTGMWQELYEGDTFSTPSLSFMASKFDEILRGTTVVFNPTKGDADQPLERLSEGQQSLFYIAFMNTIFSIRRQVIEEHYKDSEIEEDEDEEGTESEVKAERITDHILFDELKPSPLTILSIEEPENHLSQHYLARIMAQLEKIADKATAQVIVTSHCPGIVARVDPAKIRHFSMDAKTQLSSVRQLTLPEDASTEFKYVKQAVQAYPELYFSRLVILGEGDSEEFLLKRLAQLSGTPLDTAFVSVVPLAGRFVNHLWRLLNDLGIPHLTLLDYDLERRFGGWSVIQMAVEELAKVLPAKERKNLLEVNDGDDKRVLSEQEVAKMSKWDFDEENMEGWRKALEDFGVYFSYPLDVDFLMLRAYPEKYKEVYEEGPKGMPAGDSQADKDKLEARIKQAIPVVLGEGAKAEYYEAEDLELFPWYTYIFLGKGKPTSHALAWVEDEQLKIKDLPKPLDRLFKKIKSTVTKKDNEEA